MEDTDHEVGSIHFLGVISIFQLNLFRTGGRILPMVTLDVNNFLNIEANATKLGDFFKRLSGNNLVDMSLST